MFLLASKNLLVYKGRFLLATAGITCAVMLMLLLMGLYAGWRENMSTYLRHVNADLWIGQKGAWDLFDTLSLLPDRWEVVILIQYFVPQFPAAFYPLHALWMLGWVVAMSLMAASVPARRIARIDPLLAFKG